MRKFNVTVNGVTYEVEVEETGASAAVSAPAAAAPSAPAAAPKAAPKTEGKAGATAVKAPMPGTILKMNVKVGDPVKKGDIICILEAMKMENEILAPADGTISSIDAPKGASVTTDAVIVTMN